ncbi:Fe-S cluster assembly protein SufD [Corynebacterium ulceribovis]|uniref:Fe-S cluster assembly protein SufD n=1 Tax=Corynebacterium ulceribovis TaxID=487732 RepID=UPI000382C7F9|nr:Fe-S cluster assembly protein SufD [Corynebacterium ulceribovis]
MTTVENTARVHNTKGDIFASYDVADFAVPRGKDEVWRFVSLRRLRGLHDGSAPAPVAATTDVVIPDGGDATAETVGRDDSRIGLAGKPVDRIAAQAWSSFTSATVVTVNKHAVIEQPIDITITGPGEDNVAYGHTIIDVQDGAEATITLTYQGSGTYADNLEIKVGDNARLNIIIDTDWARDAVHLAGHHARLGRDATLRHALACFAGDLVRVVPRVRYDGPGGDAELTGVYFADAGQYFEQRLLVDHAQPNCRSNVMYKGALQGDPESGLPEARTAWVGDVLIRAEAQGTDTYELNRNLIIGDGARADSVPNLEIETGEIAGAGHASTTGHFDDEHLFYLMSRGIPEKAARSLIIHGFFNEVINRIPVESVRERLQARVAEELTIAGLA